jgi:hypothetical protein
MGKEKKPQTISHNRRELRDPPVEVRADSYLALGDASARVSATWLFDL